MFIKLNNLNLKFLAICFCFLVYIASTHASEWQKYSIPFKLESVELNRFEPPIQITSSISYQESLVITISIDKMVHLGYKWNSIPPSLYISKKRYQIFDEIVEDNSVKVVFHITDYPNLQNNSPIIFTSEHTHSVEDFIYNKTPYFQKSMIVDKRDETKLPLCKLYALIKKENKVTDIFSIFPEKENMNINTIFSMKFVNASNNPDTYNNRASSIEDNGISAIAMHPYEGNLYISYCDKKKVCSLHKYTIDTRELEYIGNLNVNSPITNLAFRFNLKSMPESNLFGFSESLGLVLINETTGNTRKIFPGKFNGISDFTIDKNNDIYYIDSTNLWNFKWKTKNVKKVCNNLPNTQVIEIAPDGTNLLLGVHGQSDELEFKIFDVGACKIIHDVSVPIEYKKLSSMAVLPRACQ